MRCFEVAVLFKDVIEEFRCVVVELFNERCYVDGSSDVLKKCYISMMNAMNLLEEFVTSRFICMNVML